MCNHKQQRRNKFYDIKTIPQPIFFSAIQDKRHTCQVVHIIDSLFCNIRKATLLIVDKSPKYL